MLNGMIFTKNIGMLLLAIFLILYGLIAVLGFNLGVVAGIIAILAGIFIIIGR
jgi:hypothetical protein